MRADHCIDLKGLGIHYYSPLRSGEQKYEPGLSSTVLYHTVQKLKCELSRIQFLLWSIVLPSCFLITLENSCFDQVIPETEAFLITLKYRTSVCDQITLSFVFLVTVFPLIAWNAMRLLASIPETVYCTVLGPCYRSSFKLRMISLLRCLKLARCKMFA